MKRSLLLIVFFIAGLCARAQFSTGNLVVSKIVATAGTQTVVTNADNTNNGYYGSIQEYTKSGSPIGSSIALTGMVFDARNIAHEGALALSKDGKSVTIVGFDGGMGTNSAGFRAATVGKKIARIAADKTIAYTNILGSDTSGQGYRCVFTADGSKYGVGAGPDTKSPYRTIAHGANVPSGTTTMTAQPGGGSTEQLLTPGSTMRTLGYTGGANTLYGTGSGTGATSSGGIYKFDEVTGIGTNVPLDAYNGELTKVILFDTDGNSATGDAEGNDVMYAANRSSGVGKFIWNSPLPGWNAGIAPANYINAENLDAGAATAGPNEPGYGVYTMVGELVAGKPTLYCISYNGAATGTYSTSHLIKIVDNTAANVVWSTATATISILASTTNTEIFKSISFTPQGTLSKTSFEKIAQGWIMYPNPSKGELNIDSELSGSFNIYNVLGQKVHQFKVESGSNSVSVDRLNSGTYFVEGANTTQKLIIQK